MLDDVLTPRLLLLLRDAHRANTPSRPLHYTSPSVHVFKAIDRRPCIWFTLPASVFFRTFQPWFASVYGAALAHEYDEVQRDREEERDSGVRSTPTHMPVEVDRVPLNKPLALAPCAVHVALLCP